MVMSQNIRAEWWWPALVVQGSTWKVDGSGRATVSDSDTRAKPSIEEPSKPMPSSKAPSSSAGAIATDLRYPSTSVNHSRTKRMSRSSSVRSTNSFWRSMPAAYAPSVNSVLHHRRKACRERDASKWRSLGRRSHRVPSQQVGGLPKAATQAGRRPHMNIKKLAGTAAISCGSIGAAGPGTGRRHGSGRPDLGSRHPGDSLGSARTSGEMALSLRILRAQCWNSAGSGGEDGAQGPPPSTVPPGQRWHSGGPLRQGGPAPSSAGLVVVEDGRRGTRPPRCRRTRRR